ATIADDILVFDAFIFSAGTFVIAHRAEDLLTEKTAWLGLEGTIVDRLGILNFTLRPGPDGLGRSDGDGNVVELVFIRSEDGSDFFTGVFSTHCDFAPRITLNVSERHPGLRQARCASRV